MAAPIVAATTTGGSEATIGKQYGGQGGPTAAADPVYLAIGQVRSLRHRLSASYTYRLLG